MRLRRDGTINYDGNKKVDKGGSELIVHVGNFKVDEVGDKTIN